MKNAFWLVAAIIAAGVVYSLAPDITRYIKIRSM